MKNELEIIAKIAEDLTPEQKQIFLSQFQQRKKSLNVAYLLWFFTYQLGIYFFYVGKKIKAVLVFLFLSLFISLSIMLPLVFIGDSLNSKGPKATAVIFIVNLFFILFYIVTWLISFFTIKQNIFLRNKEIATEIKSEIKNILK